MRSCWTTLYKQPINHCQNVSIRARVVASFLKCSVRMKKTSPHVFASSGEGLGRMAPAWMVRWNLARLMEEGLLLQFSFFVTWPLSLQIGVLNSLHRDRYTRSWWTTLYKQSISERQNTSFELWFLSLFACASPLQLLHWTNEVFGKRFSCDCSQPSSRVVFHLSRMASTNIASISSYFELFLHHPSMTSYHQQQQCLLQTKGTHAMIGFVGLLCLLFWSRCYSSCCSCCLVQLVN